MGEPEELEEVEVSRCVWSVECKRVWSERRKGTPCARLRSLDLGLQGGVRLSQEAG